MQASIGASAKVQGTAATAGLSTADGGNPAVTRAIVFWLIAIGILTAFHVGGAHF